MKRWKNFLGICLCWLLVLGMAQPAMATQTEEQSPVEIRTAQELQDMVLDPEGSYILMEDVDMAGFDWQPVDFSGTLDGNGHAILNLTIHNLGQTAMSTYDGNLKEYSSYFAGLFGVLSHAQVKNLTLLGVNALIDTDSSCFLGAIAGYSDRSTITNCTIAGQLELRAFTKMMGVGGVVGYGGGSVENCDVDMTLICTDTDEETRDEQFMGGVLGMGFFDINHCDVTIDGYISDCGYVHSGGLIGMLLRYPIGDWTARIRDNTVTGKITFFENNTNRRAYCSAYVGELMSDKRSMGDNTQNFQVDERFTYDVELRPEMCENPQYEDLVVESTCDAYGYTVHTCTGCGYTYQDSYTRMHHEVANWVVTREATAQQEGLRVGYCTCGEIAAEETIPMLETEPVTEPETLPAESVPPVTEPESPNGADSGKILLVAGAGIVVIFGILVLAVRLAVKRRPGGKYLR